MKKLLKSSLAAASAAVIFAGSMPYTAVNVLADSNETVNVQEADSDVYTGSWGTCKWTYDNGTLTIGEGTAQGSRTWGDYVSSIEKVVISGKITFEKRASLYGLFRDMSSLKTIEGLSNFDTSNVTNMRYMFYKCSSLTELNIDGLDTSNVTDMGSMFSGCKLLTQLNVSGLDTSNVTNMSSMFEDCNSLTELDITNFNTSKVKSLSFMFNNCSSLTALDVSGFDTANVTDISDMFQNCKKIQSLDVSKFNTSKVKSMDGMFSFCQELKNIDVSGFDTSNVTNMTAMFQKTACEELDVSNFDTSKVTRMAYMFSECNSLKSLDISKFDTSNVKDMSAMFQNVPFEELDLKNFNTSNVTNMEYMFGNASRLKSLDLSSFDTSNVKSMYYMFGNASSLQNFDVTNFNTSNVTDMSKMFRGVKCEELNLKNFDTSQVTDMSGMFSECTSLKHLDVSSFDTSNVTDMSEMFCNVKIEELDVSKFDTSKVTNMKSMFSYSNKLKYLDVSRFDTSNVTNMNGMFQNTTSIEKLDVTNFNTSNVTDMAYMFFMCYRLHNLDISSFDMSKVTKMNNMFGTRSMFSVKTPAKFPEDKDTFINECKKGLKFGKWIDETTGKEYADETSVEISEGHTYKYSAEKMSVTVSANDDTDGTSISVNATGGAPDYRYKYIMYNPKSGKWTLLSDYSSSNTYTLNMTGSGNRIIYVDVKDGLGDVTRASTEVTLTGQEELSVTASKTESDNQVVFTANAAGGSSDYTYKFIVYNKTTGTWGIVQDYSSKNTCTWTKGRAGDRDFYVDVKDSDGNVVRSKAMNVKIESTKPTAVLTPSATTLSAGGKLTLTASTDKSGCTYKFLIYNPSTNQWFKLQDYSSKNTYTWTAGSNGTRQFYVDVKDSNGNVTRSKVVNVTIGGAGALSVKTAVSANTTKVGDKVTFTAEGSGGKAGYTYKMVVYNKTTKTWGLVQNFSTNNKITWTAGSAGDREFYIDVKDADGNVVRSSVMNVKTSN